MNPDQPPSERPRSGNPVGPGAPIAILLSLGVIIGGLLGQPSIGFLTGLGIGLIVALILWRRR